MDWKDNCANGKSDCNSPEIYHNLKTKYDEMKAQLSEVTKQVQTQESVLSEFKKSPPAPARVEELARSNTAIQQTLTNLSNLRAI